MGRWPVCMGMNGRSMLPADYLQSSPRRQGASQIVKRGVRYFHQPLENLSALWVAQIQGDTGLVTIKTLVIQAILVPV